MQRRHPRHFLQRHVSGKKEVGSSSDFRPWFSVLFAVVGHAGSAWAMSRLGLIRQGYTMMFSFDYLVYPNQGDIDVIGVLRRKEQKSKGRGGSVGRRIWISPFFRTLFFICNTKLRYFRHFLACPAVVCSCLFVPFVRCREYCSNRRRVRS